MLSQVAIGVVRVLNGVLEKVNADGDARIVKSGAPLYHGDVLTLLSGEAYIQITHDPPKELALNKPFSLDGISLALKPGILNSNQAVIQGLFGEYNHISVFVNKLIASGAYFDKTESVKEPFYLDVLFSNRLISSGFIPPPLLFEDFDDFKSTINPQATVFKPVSEINDSNQALVIPNISIPNSIISGIFKGDVTELGGVNNSLPGTLKFEAQISSINGFIPGNLSGALGTFTLDTSGKWTYELNHNSLLVDSLKAGEVRVVTFDAVAKDGTIQQLTVNIHGTNDSPYVLPDNGVALEDSVLMGNVLVNDKDPEGDVVYVTKFRIDGDPTLYQAGQTASILGRDQLTILANGNYIFNPLHNYSGSIPNTTYTISDGTTENNSTLSLYVGLVNDAPEGTNKNISTLEDTPIVINATDFGFTDPDDSSANTLLAVKINSLPVEGALYLNGVMVTPGQIISGAAINANTLVYVPLANSNGSVQFTFQVQDNGGTLNGGIDLDPTSNTLRIDITPVDDAFSDANEILSTAEDINLNGNVLTGTSSVDGAVSVTHFSVAGDLTVYNAGDMATIAGVGTLRIDANGHFSFIPAPDYNGPVPLVTYMLSDGSSSDTSTLSIGVTPVADPFSDADEVLSTAEDTILNGNVLIGTSSDGGTVTVTEFTILGDLATYATGDTATIAGIGSLRIDTNGDFNFIPAANYNGSVPLVTYTLSDGSSGNVSTLSINITPVDDAFSDANEVVSTAEDTTLNGNVLTGTSSVDGAVNVTQFSVAGDPAIYTAGDAATITGIGSLRIDANGAFSFIPAANYNGAVPVVTYTLSDGSSTDTSTLSIDVTPVDDAFSDANEVLSTAEDTTLNGNVLTGTSSVDGLVSVTQFSVTGDPTTYIAGDTAILAGVGTLRIDANGAFSFIPVANYNGAVPVVTYTMSDGSSNDTSTLSIEVTPVDDAFSDANEVLSTAEDTTLNGNVLTGTSSVDGTVSVTQFSLAGDPSTYNAGDTATIAGVGALSIDANGAFSFIPEANYNGAVPVVTYTMSDGSSNDTSTLSIEVTPVDDAFSDANEVLSTAEDTTLNGNVLTGTSSVDGVVSVTQFSVAGDVAVYNAGDTASIAGIGTLLIDANGDFSFIPEANYNGVVPVVTYTMSDGSSSDTSTLSIEVTPVDDAFSDANEVLSTAEDTTLNGSVLAGTSSVDGPVSVTQFSVAGDLTVYNAGDTATIAGIGTVRIDANGAFSFIPAANYNGAVPVVTYTLSDGSSSDISTLSIDVTPVDDAFSDANEVVSTAEDTTLNGNVLTGTSSVDGPVSVTQFTVAGDPATYNVGDTATITGIGTLRIDANGDFSFIPAANYNGAVPVVTYTMSDGSSSDTSTLSIEVTPVDDAFSDANEVLSPAEDTTLNGNVLTGTSSVDGPVSVTQFSVTGDPATYIAGDTAILAGIGTLRIDANGAFSFIPAANYNGAVPVVTYTLSDGSSSDISTLSIDVTPVDDAFSDANEVVSTAEDTTLNGNVLTGTSSVDGPVSVTQFTVAGDPATYNVGDTATITGIGTLRIDANGDFSFIPAANYNGAVPVVTYTMSDGSSSDTSTLSIEVTPVDDAFSDANEVLSPAEDTSLNGNVLTGTSSVDGPVSVTQFSVTGDPTTYIAGDTAILAGIGTLRIDANGAFSFIPAANYNGAVPVVTYTLSDGSSSDISTLSIDVTPVDDAFSDANEVVSTAEDTTLNGNVLTGTSSVDGPVSVSQFSVTGDPATYIAGDTAILAGIGTLRIDANGAFSFIPEANYNGAVPVVTYTMSDGSSNDTSTLSIDVTPVDDAFSDANEVVSTAEDTTLNGNVLTGTSSVDGPVSVTQFSVTGDPTTYIAGDTAILAGIGTLRIDANGAFSFIPEANYNGAVPVVTYTVSDGSSSDTSTLSIEVTPVDDAFSDSNEVVSAAEDTILNGNLLTGTSSVDGPVSVTQFSVAGDVTVYNPGDMATISGIGTLRIDANGAFSFIPVANYNGAVPVVTYTMSDGSSNDTSTLSIDVTPVDDAFSDANEVLSTAEDTPLGGNVLTGTSSVDGAVNVTQFSVAGDLTVYNAGDTASIAGIGTLRIDANGDFSFIPTANYNGAVPVVTYTLSDGSSTDTSTLSIEVTPVDDAFSDANEVLSTAEDTTLNGNVLTGTSSVDGPVSVTQFSVAGDVTVYNPGDMATISGIGTLRIDANGAFSFIPAANYNGAVPVVTYTLSDGSSSDTSTLSIDVTPVDDAFSDANEVVSTAEDTTLNGNVLTGTSSVDGPVSVTQFSVTGNPSTYNAGDTATIAGVGALSIDANGAFSFIPVANYNGTVPVVTYTMSDGSSNDTSTLSIEVTPVDDAFSDANEVLSTAEDTTLNGNVLTGTSSVDGPVSVTQFSVTGDPSTYNAGDTATIDGVGTLSIDTNGAFSFIPAANYNGAVPVVTYTLSDGSSNDTSTLSIDVTSVDDAFSDANEVVSTAEDTTLNGNVLTGTSSVDGPVSVTQFSVTGDPATYFAGDTAILAGIGTLRIDANGAFSFIPVANYNGAVPVVTYTLSDGSSNDTSTLSIEVTPVDDAFSDANEVLSTAEDTTLNGNVLTGTSSVDGPVSVTQFSVTGDPSTYNAGDTATIAGVGALSIDANGAFSFIPVANYNGAVPVVTYTVSDGSSNDTSTLSIEVTPVDDAFSDANEVLSTAEDTTLNGNVLTGTSSVDGPVSVTQFSVTGDPATYIAGDTATITGVGALSIDANGAFSFIPVANYNGTVPVVTYTMSDGSSSDTSTLSIEVTPVDDAFSDANEVLSTAEDTTLNGNVLTGTSSVDGPVSVTQFSVTGDPSTYNAGDTATIAGVGALSIDANGAFSFIPVANYNGTVPVVTYTMSDGSSSDTSTLSIDVTPVDDAFSDANEVLSTAEDTTLNGNVLTGTSSVDGVVSVTQFSVTGDVTVYNAGDTATIAGVGALSIDANGAFSFIPVANYNGTVPVVTYTMSDGSSSDTSTLSIEVTPVDDPFSDANEVLSTAEDTTLNGNVLTGTSSVDGPVSVTQFSVTGDPATYIAGDTATITGVGALSIDANGAFSFIPVANYNGAVPVVTYTLSDGSSSDTSTLSIDVTPVDDAFSDANEVLSTAEDTTLNGNVLTGTSSVDGVVSVTQFSVAGDVAVYNAGDTATIAGIGAVRIDANGAFSFIPEANYNGAVPVVTYTMSDGSSSDTSTLSIEVTPVDDAFSDANEVLSTAEDTTLNGNVLTGTSSVDGPVSVTQFSVTGDPATYIAGDTATITGVGALSIDANGAFSFIPVANYNGAVPVVTYTLSDGSSSDTSTLSIDVTPVDDAFSDANEVLSTAEDTTLWGNVLTGTSSVDGPISVTQFSVTGDPSTYNAGDTATIAGVGTLSIDTNGAFSFIPVANYNGAVPVVTYTMSDGSSNDTSTLSIEVTPVDDAFSDANDVLSTAEDTTLNGNVLTGTSSVDGVVSVTQFSVAGDVAVYNAGDTATIAGIGAVRIDANGAFSFIPVANYNGTVPVVTYTMSDGSSSDTSTLSIEVTPVDDAFSDANEVLSTAEDTTLNGNVLTGTSSVDGPVRVTQFSVTGDLTVYNAGDTATITGIGTLRIDANGDFSFIPAANYNGAVPVVTYTMSDGSSTDTSTLSIDVTPVDDAFSDANEVVSTAEDTTLNGSVLTGTSSVDGPVSVTQFSVAGDVTVYNAGNTATIAGVGILRIDANGTFSFIPAANYNGAVPVVTYTLSDGSSSDTSTLNIDVTPVDDAFSDANEVLSTAEDTTLNGNVLTGTSSVDGPVSVAQFTVAGDVTVYNAGDTASIAGIGTVRIDFNGAFSFIPAANYYGAVPVVTYIMSDGSSSDTSTLSISVTPVDDAFSDANEVLSMAEDTALNGSVLTGTSSVDGPVSVTQFSVAGDVTVYNAGNTATIAGVGTLRIDANGDFSFIPLANYNGAVPVATYTLSDGSSSDTSTLSISVTPVDDAFSDANEVLSTAEDTILNGSVLTGTSSVDGPVSVTQFIVAGDPATYNAGDTATIVGIGTLRIDANGAFSFIPATNYNGAVPLTTYTLTDGSSSDVSTLSINVTPVNDSPVNGLRLTQTMNEDGSRAFNVTNSNAFSVTDVDSSTVTTTLSVLHGILTASSSAATAQGVTLTNNGTSSITLVGAPDKITLVLDGLVYKPTADYDVSDTLTMTSTDGTLTDTDLMTINITSIADITDDTASTNEDTAVVINVLANDSFENPGRTITAINGLDIVSGGTVSVSNGTVLLNANGTLTFTPVANYNGNTSFTYTVTSGGATETATVNLTVNSVNDAPQGADYLLTINNTNPVVLTTSYFSMTDVNDSPANALLNVRISTLPASGTLALNGVAVTAGQNISAVDIAAGLLVYTPVSNFSGSTSFTFQVRDDGGTANGGVNLDQSPNSFTFNLPVVADTPVIYAHIGLPTITGGTSFIAANFSNDLDENSLSNWSSVALFSNTFAEVQGGNGKLQTEASLFNSTAWAGQTGTDATEVSNFNSRWVKSGGLMTYNNGNVNDDAQGILLLNSNQMTVEERALTSYLITVGMYADASASQANGVGFVFGYQDSSNYFLLRWENPNTVYAPGGAAFESAPGQYLELSLVQVVAGTAIDLARTTFNGDDFFNVSINVSPNGISVSAADVNNSSATANLEYVYGSISGGTSTAPALNSIGLYTFDNDSLVQWDNIVIKQPVSFQYILQTEAYLTDTDGSETLSNITLSSIPAGATLFDTVTNTAVTVTGGSATVVAGNDIRLTTTTALTTAQINAITAAVTATETSNGSTSTQTTPVLFEVLGNSPAETISGSASGEWITGEAGNDVLNARGGADVIIGGLGNDTITTGGGSDQIVLLKGQGGATAGAAPIDTITDFTVNTDTIVIKGSNIIGVSVSIPTSYTYTITVNYSGGAATEYFKVTLSNGAMLNDSGDNQLTGVVISGGTATIDGTIVGAILYLDINGNNQEDEGERLGITDQYGHVEWVLDLAKLDVNGDGQYVLGEARAVQTGGFDVDTGLSYDINLFGPVGSAIISPLTSLLQAQLESGFDYQTANANIVARLGLPEGTELINLNPILGANEILAQNASVMTAAVQFAELAAIRYSTDEGRVSFSVFDAISKALLELPERTIADFSDKAFLQDIALHLDLGDLASPEVIEFMAASQQALQVSMGALAPGESALAAISEVQYLTQGSYAQILEHYMNGYLPAYLLSDISVIINAFSSSSITYEELKDFNNQFNTVVNQEINSSSGISTDGSADYYSYDFIHNAESLINTFMTTHDLPVSSSQEYQIYTLSDLGLVDDYVLFYDANTQENTSTPSPSMGGVELHGSSGSESIYGTEGNDLIFGGEGDDHLYGGQGDDTILGGLGNDVIYGGMGNDHMTGGGGNDIFVFEKADIGDKPVIDTITDFKLGTDGDAGGDKSTLDLSDLFKDSTLSSESLDTLLQISTVHNESTNQTDTVIKTDLTGNAQFNASPETIVLSGVDVVSAYGTSDSAELINHLLAANILVMGH